MCLGVPGKVLSIVGTGIEASGIVSFAGVEREVAFAFVPEVKCGDFVIVHVVFAIAVLNEAAAQRTIDLIEGVE